MAEQPPFETSPDEVNRTETGIRILLSLLFMVAVRVVGLVLFVVIVFELLYTLITQRRPGGEVRRFARRTLDYAVAAVRYLTYNDDEPPFPFTEFPRETETPSRNGG
jgi:hypothetical protein